LVEEEGKGESLSARLVIKKKVLAYFTKVVGIRHLGKDISRRRKGIP